MKILICEIKINLFTVSMCVFNIKIMLNNIYVKYKLYVVEILNVIRKKINLLQSLLLFLKKKNNEIINKLALKILFLANKNCFLNENDFLGKYFLLYKKNKFLVYRFMQEIENFSSIISLYETEQFLLMYKQHLNYSQRSIENIKKKNIVLFYPTFFLIAFERFRKSTIFLVKTAKKFSKYYLCKIPLFLLFEIIEILLKLIKVSFIRLKYIKIFYFLFKSKILLKKYKKNRSFLFFIFCFKLICVVKYCKKIAFFINKLTFLYKKKIYVKKHCYIYFKIFFEKKIASIIILFAYLKF
ncbi:hypothetical protein CPARA_2gp290 (nucleomorph) [Cryptomonas paramecium]|uniref:Uncharacterized protein n=1 Tax=Cryptomonas paramaecium TaxID=2898 RepID=F2HI02_9CRYP|nr:hypothetical protein CPARA_2gp290 [Cryptomonas paramecium]AEA38948.1 hypothetical protein CPARA_2gp290 [Cryptomonas paramecium]